MRNLRHKRFGVHEVTEGPRKGSLHVATKSYQSYFGELCFLQDYLNRRVLPTDPEEVSMREIILNLQNILEYEVEQLIRSRPASRGFVRSIDEGYVSFKWWFQVSSATR